MPPATACPLAAICTRRTATSGMGRCSIPSSTLASRGRSPSIDTSPSNNSRTWRGSAHRRGPDPSPRWRGRRRSCLAGTGGATRRHRANPALRVLELVAAEARIGRRATRDARHRGHLAEELTDRELSILRALTGKATQREIGAALFLSLNIVKGYTKSPYRKFGRGHPQRCCRPAGTHWGSSDGYRERRRNVTTASTSNPAMPR